MKQGCRRALICRRSDYLHDDDAVVKGSCFRNDWRVFSVGPGINVAFSIRLYRTNEDHIGDKIHQQSGIKFDVGVDGSNVEPPIFQQLGDAQALWTCVGEIYFLRDSQFKQCELFGPADTRNDQMQIVNLLRINLYQGPREEISLFLVISFQHDPVAADDESFQSVDDLLLGEDWPLHPGLDELHAPSFLVAPRRPGVSRFLSVFRSLWHFISPIMLTNAERCSSERVVLYLRSTLQLPWGAKYRPSGWLRGLRLCGCPPELHTNVRDRG